ncbi:MFS transporter [Saccharopolyspora gloriosae]|uniref:MFS family permease n=1 Tax=Saccharopolyspora gloriosae TaxID=455344 RepID=A0A840NLN0_9PSEU|nr:MFS family permease [Saccharopolyspora gloriosae]
MHESDSTLARPRRLARGAAFAVSAAVIGLCLAAATAPAPLYKLYQAQWGFSTPALTLVYAVYCVGVLVALLLFGRLSDSWGRRPVIIAGLVGLLAAMAVFLNAYSVSWLFVARGLQGLATGIAISAAGAALLEFAPPAEPGRGGLLNAVASSLGVGCGGLFGAVLVQFSPSPLVVPFAVLAVLVAALVVTAAFLPETVARGSGPRRLRFAGPRVPRGIRAPFVLSGLGITAAWANVGLYQSLVPTLAPALLRSQTYLAAGLAIFALGGASAVAPLLLKARATSTLIAGGLVTLVAGVAIMALSLEFPAPVLFIAASLVIGTGVGTSMVGSIRLVGEIAPPTHRASVMAAFYVVAYCAISVPAVIVGFLVREIGTTATFQLFAATIALLSLTALAVNRQVLRPARKTPAPALARDRN